MKFPKIAMLIAILLASAGSAEAGKRVALVIGNDNYETLKALKNARRDAQDMAKKLEQRGFEVILLTNGKRRQIGRSLDDFTNRLAGAEAGLVFYAGHGVQSEGQNYFIPSDAEIETEGDLAYEAISGKKFVDAMKQGGADVNIIIFDACRDNPLPKSNRSGSRGLAVTSVPSGVRGLAMLFSAGPGETAADGDPGGNGLFTNELLKALDKPGLTLESVFKETAQGVNRRSNGKQTPWINASLTGDFYFQKDSLMSSLQSSPSNPQTAAKQPQSVADTSVEMLFWDSIKNSKDRIDYEAYISSFPNGTFVSIAKNRIIQIEELKFRVTLLDTYMYVQKKSNVRGEPTVKASKVGILEPGESVAVTGKAIIDGEAWYQVSASGHVGYVFGNLLGDNLPYKPRTVSKRTQEDVERPHPQQPVHQPAQQQTQQPLQQNNNVPAAMLNLFGGLINEMTKDRR